MTGEAQQDVPIGTLEFQINSFYLMSKSQAFNIKRTLSINIYQTTAFYSQKETERSFLTHATLALNGAASNALKPFLDFKTSK